jgi:hypothetical protein
LKSIFILIRRTLFTISEAEYSTDMNMNPLPSPTSLANGGKVLLKKDLNVLTEQEQPELKLHIRLAAGEEPSWMLDVWNWKMRKGIHL